MGKVNNFLYAGMAIVIGGIVAFDAFGPDGSNSAGQSGVDTTLFQPNWAAISVWPGIEGGGVAQPDPNRLTAVIVLDDSGSMENDIFAAKVAVAEAVNQLPDSGRVALTALNAGLLLAPTPVPEARSQVAAVLERVRADGGTPLGGALAKAHNILMDEAATQRGFGTYRIVLTTDGEASDDLRLEQEVMRVVADTPIELVTIGIGIGSGHV
ncbi:MAG: vWA domain-containing protein, partial [Pseudomonadota bacterium]